MFEGFEATADRQGRRRFAASTGVSLALCALLAGGAIALASRARTRTKPPPVNVVFKKPTRVAAAKPPPPPPPPPRPKPRAKPAARAGNAATPAAAPKAMPEGALAEGNASDFVSGGIASIEWGDAGGPGALAPARGRASAPPPPPPPKPRVESAGGELPPGAIPPRPADSNAIPEYPESMRRKGIEGLVVLRVLVGADGRVSDIDVVRGAEPFLAAAIAVVQGWRYEPAVINGKPTAARRIIRVPFRLRA